MFATEVVASTELVGEREQMQNIVHALKNWYPTSVLAEPELATELAKVEAQEALRLRMEEQSAEPAQIVEKAKKNGAYLKAPNGEQTNLTEHQWALVRTKSFKQEFGDWERVVQVAKLLNSEPIIASGEEWRGKYELDRQSVRSYIAGSLRSNEGYKNKDTGSIVKISKKKASKTASHGSEMHLKTVALIPQMIENSIYLGEEPNKKKKHGFTNFRYYAVGLKLGGVDYTVRLTTGVGDDETYYDHALTQIKKEELAGRRGSLEGKAYDRRCPPSDVKDRRLLSLLQGDCSKLSNTVDKNGEPKSAEVEAFERKHKSTPIQQVRWLKQDNKVVGWLNPNTGEIVLSEEHNTSVAIEAFWHATFHLATTTAPRLCNKMLAYAQDSTKALKRAVKKRYPEFDKPRVRLEKVGAELFVIDYAGKIEKSLESNILFVRAWRALGNDEVNLGKIAKLPSKKAVATLANAFAHRKHIHSVSA